MRGVTWDATGAAIPDVKTTPTNVVDTGVVTDLTTNAAGLYDAASPVSRRHQMMFTKEGFETCMRPVDAQLSVDTATEQIEVVAEAPLLQTKMDGSLTIGQLAARLTDLQPRCRAAAQ